jgi:hypothetical protein
LKQTEGLRNFKKDKKEEKKQDETRNTGKLASFFSIIPTRQTYIAYASAVIKNLFQIEEKLQARVNRFKLLWGVSGRDKSFLFFHL